MLRTKFKCNWSVGVGDGFEGSTTYGHGGHIGHVTWTVSANFVSSADGGST